MSPAPVLSGLRAPFSARQMGLALWPGRWRDTSPSVHFALEHITRLAHAKAGCPAQPMSVWTADLGMCSGPVINHLYSRRVRLRMRRGDHDACLLVWPSSLGCPAAVGTFRRNRIKIRIFVRDDCNARTVAALACRLAICNCQSYACMPQNKKHCARGGRRTVQKLSQKTLGPEWGAELCC